MNIVISQSMLFPWVGLLEQMKLADVFVHYDDVQFSKGGFVNRVQLKFPEGVRWMTIPLSKVRLGQPINRVRPLSEDAWKQQHLDMIHRSVCGAPYARDAIRMAEKIYGQDYSDIGMLSRMSMLELARYFEIDVDTRFVDVADMNIPGSSSERVLDIVKSLHGDVYITGHGAARYLNHEMFESNHVEVRYMDYQLKPYPQSHGEFTPYVSSLDLVAHCGRAGIDYICSNTLTWRSFIK